MTMDRTLKTHGGLARVRSVLSRAERIAHLVEEGKFDPAVNCPFGLPKTKVKHSKAGTKTKKVAEEAVPAEGAEAAAAAPAADGKAAKAPAAKATAAKAPAAKEDKKKK